LITLAVATFTVICLDIGFLFCLGCIIILAVGSDIYPEG
jgi:hypothetical protein